MSKPGFKQERDIQCDHAGIVPNKTSQGTHDVRVNDAFKTPTGFTIGKYQPPKGFPIDLAISIKNLSAKRTKDSVISGFTSTDTGMRLIVCTQGRDAGFRQHFHNRRLPGGDTSGDPENEPHPGASPVPLPLGEGAYRPGEAMLLHFWHWGQKTAPRPPMRAARKGSWQRGQGFSPFL